VVATLPNLLSTNKVMVVDKVMVVSRVTAAAVATSKVTVVVFTDLHKGTNSQRVTVATEEAMRNNSHQDTLV
jgi:hypothetical protein